LLLLIFLECLVCLFIWWRGVVVALGDQPGHRSWDMLQRRRRADWVRNELEQRPWWWLMLSGLALLVLVDWFRDKWEPDPSAGRAATPFSRRRGPPRRRRCRRPRNR
jgi:hypothetical protein